MDIRPNILSIIIDLIEKSTFSLLARLLKFYKMEEASIFVMTFNLADSEIPHGSFSFLPSGYDLYFLGFEEVGPFVPIACDAKQEALSNELRSHFGDDYFILCDKSMLAIKNFIAVKSSLKESVWATSEFLIPTGADGQYGNKGAVAVSLRIDEAKLMFICAHFSAHDKNIEDRNQNYADILTRIKEYSDNVNPFDSHNYIVFVGDLNYRISKPYKEATKLAMSGRFAELKASDQLTKEKSAMRVFNGFFEEEINFPPTYKFDKNSPMYDTSKKKRVPSYTDRILFFAKSRKTISVSNYTANMDILLSDHRPVTAEVKIRIVEKPETNPVVAAVKKSAVCRI